MQSVEHEEQSVTVLPKVGSAIAEKLARLDIVTIRDLLFHIPYRYENRTRVVPIDSLEAGRSSLVVGRIVNVSVRGHARRRMLVVDVDDGTGVMAMRLFHFNTKQRYVLENGDWLRCYGEPRLQGSIHEMVHPDYRVFQTVPSSSGDQFLTPVYPLTEGLTQHTLRSIVSTALSRSATKFEELLPRDELDRLDLPGIGQALRMVHAPPVESVSETDPVHLNPGVRRLIVEELLAHQVARRGAKKRRQESPAPSMQPKGDLSVRLRESLTFEPTNSQRVAIREIIGNLKRSTPMLRLLQGDVGCGKTLVAAAAAAWVVDSGYQFAIMAPTELLAEQHMKSFSAWFAPLGVEVLLLTGSLTAKEKKLTQTAIRNGDADIVVGTHALFQEGIEFKKLGLFVIDEQHRFGVDQRLAMRQKGMQSDHVPHQLSMTATPIPRSLAMTFFADLDVSSITEMPPGRLPARTELVSSDRRKAVMEQVRDACADGAQVYWVCPFIDKSQLMVDVEAATETEALVQDSLPTCRVGLMHGRMKGADKDRVMNEFRRGALDILVATTMIEVGVDVPNATLMVVENSERLGLAQLHQLRGRVGRGSAQSRCILLHGEPIGKATQERLHTMLRTNDGFEIAETDLRLRDTGDLLGTRQTGAQLFRIVEFPRDAELARDVVGAVAESVMRRYQELEQPLIRRWMSKEGMYGEV